MKLEIQFLLIPPHMLQEIKKYYSKSDSSEIISNIYKIFILRKHEPTNEMFRGYYGLPTSSFNIYIGAYFRWALTIQGHSYWAEICKNIIENKEAHLNETTN